jgi:hypothetical protein
LYQFEGDFYQPPYFGEDLTYGYDAGTVITISWNPGPVTAGSAEDFSLLLQGFSDSKVYVNIVRKCIISTEKAQMSFENY